MELMVANRREQLEQFVRQNPEQAFARYGLAMELMRSGEREAALEQFRLLQAQHPDYPAGFQQAGQLLIAMERKDEARAVLQQGMGSAARAGDHHAAGEMQGLLDELG